MGRTNTVFYSSSLIYTRRIKRRDVLSVSSINRANICFIYLHLFIHPSRVHCELTKSAPSWLDSSVGRALHWHRRGHGFESGSSLNFFFRLSFRNCLSCVVTARIFLLFDLSSAVQNICFIYLHLFLKFLSTHAPLLHDKVHKQNEFTFSRMVLLIIFSKKIIRSTLRLR